MSKTYTDFTYCALPDTPRDFDEAKFKAGDTEQISLYKANKTPRQHTKLTSAETVEGTKNYARFVPDGCCFIDFDDVTQANEMYEIIIRSKVRCLILKTMHGYHFLFRVPEFYTGEMTGATNWFGYKFDTKASWIREDGKHIQAVQIMRACGMNRKEIMSWEPDTPILPVRINTEMLDVLPYWLWGKLKDKDLHKEGHPGKSIYDLTNTPFTQLMKMKEGGRHSHIVEKCGYFACSNGFEIDDFKDLIKSIHDQYLRKIGTPMPDSDLFRRLRK